MTEIIINNYKLDNEQLKPILENPKYSLIVAGAGSGKTLTILGKIKYMLNSKLVKPDEICVISFTNEAVNNLKNNIQKNCGVLVPTFTFHKLALSILNDDEYQVLPSNYLDYLIDEFFNTYCHYNESLANNLLGYYHILFKSRKKYDALIKSKEFWKLKELIITFINLFKSNGYDDKYWLTIMKKASKKERNILYIIYAIYLLYNEEKLSAHKIDFDDMITYATNKIKDNVVNTNYKLVIIDEFQDTSMVRFNLVKAILDKNGASLCVVGDDYQSIYHFSGCDINLFLNFNQWFSNAKVYHITNTYRNSQELIDVAGAFIMRNPYQLKKNLISNIYIKKPIVIVYNAPNILTTLITKMDKNKSLFILGRYNFDINKYLNDNEFCLNNKIININGIDNENIKYMTIHSSKGLEADNVIILNLNNDVFGFPSLKNDQILLKYVKKSFTYPYEEERRLFYVALTRTKGYVYLIVNKNNPSKFIKEIINNSNVLVWKY